jgi:hypothetical protein
VETLLAARDAELLGKLILAIHGSGAVMRARGIAESGAERFPDNVELARIARLIVPPRVTKADPLAKADREADLTWLAEHANKYPGQWLVLSGGRLWAHAASLAEARERADAAGLKVRPLLHHVPER